MCFHFHDVVGFEPLPQPNGCQPALEQRSPPTPNVLRTAHRISAANSSCTMPEQFRSSEQNAWCGFTLCARTFLLRLPAYVAARSNARESLPAHRATNPTGRSARLRGGGARDGIGASSKSESRKASSRLLGRDRREVRPRDLVDRPLPHGSQSALGKRADRSLRASLHQRLLFSRLTRATSGPAVDPADALAPLAALQSGSVAGKCPP